MIAGAPVLRDPAGERTLAPGDLVCFPSGHLGAHTLKGPGRFVIFATGRHVEPWMSVYPDSDKVSGPGGILLRAARSATGTARERRDRRSRSRSCASRRTSPPRPVVNALAVAHGGARPAAGRRPARRGRGGAGARRGMGALPLRVRAGEVAAGPGRNAHLAPPARRGSARDRRSRVPPGRPGRCSPAGRIAASQPCVPCSCRRLGLPVNVCYPDSGRWLIRNGPGEDELVVAP